MYFPFYSPSNIPRKHSLPQLCLVLSNRFQNYIQNCITAQHLVWVSVKEKPKLLLLSITGGKLIWYLSGLQTCFILKVSGVQMVNLSNPVSAKIILAKNGMNINFHRQMVQALIWVWKQHMTKTGQIPILNGWKEVCLSALSGFWRGYEIRKPDPFIAGQMASILSKKHFWFWFKESLLS